MRNRSQTSFQLSIGLDNSGCTTNSRRNNHNDQGKHNSKYSNASHDGLLLPIKLIFNGNKTILKQIVFVPEIMNDFILLAEEIDIVHLLAHVDLVELDVVLGDISTKLLDFRIQILSKVVFNIGDLP